MHRHNLGSLQLHIPSYYGDSYWQFVQNWEMQYCAAVGNCIRFIAKPFRPAIKQCLKLHHNGGETIFGVHLVSPYQSDLIPVPIHPYLLSLTCDNFAAAELWTVVRVC